MANPQPGPFAQGVSSHRHVEYRLRPGASDADIVEALTAARATSALVGGPNVTFGFAPDLWRRLAPDCAPEVIKSFPGIAGIDGLVAPVTQSDIWCWASSAYPELVADACDAVSMALGAVADLEFLLDAYSAADARDPTGFIDGTENPKLDEAYEIALYPDGSPGAGGSSVLIQKWVHKLAEFEALPVREQEDIIGRSKRDSVQIADSAMPATSHVSRNTVVGADGNERHIYRKNTQFANDAETGTQFIGLTNQPELMMLMLDRMFGTAGDGLIDRLAQFSVPVTGSWYFVPSMDDLTTIFGPIDDGDDDDDGQGGETDDGSSLGIGSLRDEAESAVHLPEE